MFPPFLLLCRLQRLLLGAQFFYWLFLFSCDKSYHKKGSPMFLCMVNYPFIPVYTHVLVVEDPTNISAVSFDFVSTSFCLNRTRDSEYNPRVSRRGVRRFHLFISSFANDFDFNVMVRYTTAFFGSCFSYFCQWLNVILWCLLRPVGVQ